jgi:hypothetical protein
LITICFAEAVCLFASEQSGYLPLCGWYERWRTEQLQRSRKGESGGQRLIGHAPPLIP